MWRNWRNRVRTDCVGRLAAWLKVAWITHDVIVIITMTLHHTYSSPTDSDCVNRICPFHWMNFLLFLLSLSSLSVVIRVRLSGILLFSLRFSVLNSASSHDGGELARKLGTRLDDNECAYAELVNRRWPHIKCHTTVKIFSHRPLSTAYRSTFFCCLVWMSYTCHLMLVFVHVNESDSNEWLLLLVFRRRRLFSRAIYDCDVRVDTMRDKIHTHSTQHT